MEHPIWNFNKLYIVCNASNYSECIGYTNKKDAIAFILRNAFENLLYLCQHRPIQQIPTEAYATRVILEYDSISWFPQSTHCIAKYSVGNLSNTLSPNLVQQIRSNIWILENYVTVNHTIITDEARLPAYASKSFMKMDESLLK